MTENSILGRGNATHLSHFVSVSLMHNIFDLTKQKKPTQNGADICIEM